MRGDELSTEQMLALLAHADHAAYASQIAETYEAVERWENFMWPPDHLSDF